MDTVTLTCNKDSNEAAASYEWYKDGTKDGTQISETWNIGNAGANGNGAYTCKVVTAKTTSDPSDAFAVEFLCECYPITIQFLKIAHILLLCSIFNVGLSLLLSTFFIALSNSEGIVPAPLLPPL